MLKRISVSVLLSVLAGLSMAGVQGSYGVVNRTPSPEFERMKELVGTWRGTSAMGDKVEEATVEYRLTSGGSAVLEKLYPGTPKEMVSLYYNRNGKLMMTHYCMLGNRPQLELKSADVAGMDFLLSPNSDIDASNETHMHALRISFDGKDKITQKWTCFEQGKEKHVSTFTLKRVTNA